MSKANQALADAMTDAMKQIGFEWGELSLADFSTAERNRINEISIGTVSGIHRWRDAWLRAIRIKKAKGL